VTQWTAGTGQNGQLRLTLEETGYDAVANTSQVHVKGEIYTPPGSAHYNGDLSVSLSNSINWSTSSWSFDATGGWHTLVDATVTLGHAADGTLNIAVVFALNSNTGTSGVGGPSSVTGSMSLTTLTVPPGQPDNVTSNQVSDSRIDVSWQNHYASNGVPTGIGVDQRINGGSWTRVFTTSSILTSVSIASAANRKTEFRVVTSNGAGSAPNSDVSNASWSTPAAPTGVTATKNSSGNIVVTWTNKVAFDDYSTFVDHGVVGSGGTITWDAVPTTGVASGGTSFTHTSPNSSQVHVYRVRSKNQYGTLVSSWVQSNSVQLLAAPNAPTLATTPQYADAAVALTASWTHNPVDTTAQTAYEFQTSTDGGSTWSSSGKVTSTAHTRTLAVQTAATVLRMRVRTWGQATTGGSDGTGASPWSTTRTTTFKSKPTVSVAAPTGTVTQAHTTVDLTFAQAQGASFVSGTVTLKQGSTVLETVTTTSSTGIPLATRLGDGGTYTLTATAKDSNGLSASSSAAMFSVDYADPSPATITASYVPDAGMAQVDLTFPDPTEDQVAPATFTLTRTINGVVETVADQQPITGDVTVVDTTPQTVGVNSYTVVTYSSDGAGSAPASVDLPVQEGLWAFLSTGDGFATAVKFYGNLAIGANPSRNSGTVQAAGRSRPIALFGETSTLDVNVQATILADEGSTIEEIEAFLLTAGLVCYRDPSGRRVIGVISGKVDNHTFQAADLSFTVSEAT
jgi:hypothetical protein